MLAADCGRMTGTSSVIGKLRFADDHSSSIGGWITPRSIKQDARGDSTGLSEWKPGRGLRCGRNELNVHGEASDPEISRISGSAGADNNLA